MTQKKLAGQTPFDRFQALAKGLVNVPKAEVDRKVLEQREQAKKQAAKGKTP